MARRPKTQRDLNLERMFEPRTEAWERAGLRLEFDEQQVRRARIKAVVFGVLLIAVAVGYQLLKNDDWKALKSANLGGLETPITVIAVIALVVLGWELAAAVARMLEPTFLRRMDPATAGSFAFLLRLVTVTIVLVVALAIAGVKPQTLAVGGAFTAVVVGLAAQQTLGNVISGVVLITARPFRVGDRVRFQAGAVGGRVEGIVSDQGLLYTTLLRGGERMMIPNNVVLGAAVVPLREPEGIDVRVRLSSGVPPSQVQAILDSEVSIPTRSKSVMLEEVDGDTVVVRVQATPQSPADGSKLADEIMNALSSVTDEHDAVTGDETLARGDEH